MIKLTSEYLTKIKTIDEQHKELVDILNSVESMGKQSADKEEEQEEIKAETEKTLDFLNKYVFTHFSNEEAMMRQYEYPEYDWHRTWHQGYIAKVRELMKEYKQNGPSHEFTYILDEFVIKWILKHIQNVDVKLGDFLRKKGLE